MYNPEGEKRATFTGAVCRFNSERKSTSTGIFVLDDLEPSLVTPDVALWMMLHI
jgi:hypothetical protein